MKRSGLQISHKECENCLFSEHPIVRKGRKAEIVRGCLRDDTHFLCHVPMLPTDEDEQSEVVCHGFYKRYTSQMIRIAGRLGMIIFVDVENNNLEISYPGEK